MHTKGPWIVGTAMNPDRPYGIIAPDGWTPKPGEAWTEDDDSQCVAEVCASGNEQTALDDARLIAAAPTTLEALTRLLAACELIDEEYYATIDGAMDEARVAIALAREGGAA